LQIDLFFICALLALGAFGGFAAGLLGIGGGAMMVPFMTMLFTAYRFPLEHVLHMAVATSLSTILFTSISSVRAHHARGAVHWPWIAWLGPGAFAGTLLGAQVASLLKTPWLALAIAVFIGHSAYKLIVRKNIAAADTPELSSSSLLAAGGVAGALSSVAGAGGAFITVPFLRKRGAPVYEAVGTSAAVGFPIAAGGLLGYAFAGQSLHDALPPHSLGYIYLPALLITALASMSFAPLGARAAHALNVAALQRVFAVFLSLLALYMLYKSASTFGVI
jgi:uncharacterized membrane protein YfcA